MEISKMKRQDLKKWIKKLDDMLKIEEKNTSNYVLYSLWYAEAINELIGRDNRRAWYLKKHNIKIDN